MKIWSDKKYYERIARREKFDHPGFLRAVEYCKDAKAILDVGCGDGSKLKKLGGKTTKRKGCDVSDLAEKFGFDKFDGIKLPYKDNCFDRVVSFFVLEHTEKPKELLAEMVRVLRPGGLLIILAPNYGAPNRASPNFKGSRILKLLFNRSWNRVQPQTDTVDTFESDFDTTLEPYLGDVARFLRDKKLKIVEADSFWEMELPNAKPWQKVFRIFKYWGPHLFVVAEKPFDGAQGKL
ncbi:class I SAM-dependent methyltransferase [Patescibacteria group bacterium]|nr:class I SAM-dependent methyltransferase [Patescibacteria group bacterium]